MQAGVEFKENEEGKLFLDDDGVEVYDILVNVCNLGDVINVFNRIAQRVIELQVEHVIKEFGSLQEHCHEGDWIDLVISSKQ